MVQTDRQLERRLRSRQGRSSALAKRTCIRSRDWQDTLQWGERPVPLSPASGTHDPRRLRTQNVRFGGEPLTTWAQGDV